MSIEASVLGHVLVDIFSLDLKEKAIGVHVEVLAVAPVLPPELVVVDVVHQVF